MTLTDDRFAHEDSALCPTRRREEAEKLAKLGALRERFLLEASVFANGVAAIDHRFIDLWDSARRDPQGLTQPEAIQGFLDCVSDCVADLIDHDHVEACEQISEHGSDE
jgi:hypothetical protein